VGGADPVSGPRNEHSDDRADETELSAEPATDALPVARPAGGGLAPGVTGVVMVVLLIMGVGMLVAQFMGGHDDQPGPGALTVGAHLAGAVVGVFCYRATRRTGIAKPLGLLAILVVAALLLWFFWWAPS
jgi:hypothetical protein